MLMISITDPPAAAAAACDLTILFMKIIDSIKTVGISSQSRAFNYWYFGKP